MANGLAKPTHRCLRRCHRFGLSLSPLGVIPQERLAKQTFGPGTKTFEDYHDLLNDPTVDAVLIALPNSLHAPVLQAAARSRKHLFFEPPVAEDSETATHVLDALAASDYVVQADLELRCLPVMDDILACLQSGAVGEPLMTKIRLWCNWGYGGGAWYDEVQEQSFFLWLGCWYLDVLDCIFKQAAVGASVVGGRHSNGTLMDAGWASLVYTGGKIGQLEFNLVIPQETSLSWLLPVDQEKLSLIYRREGGDGAVKQAIGILNTHPLPHPLTDSWACVKAYKGSLMPSTRRLAPVQILM